MQDALETFSGLAFLGLLFACIISMLEFLARKEISRLDLPRLANPWAAPGPESPLTPAEAFVAGFSRAAAMG